MSILLGLILVALGISLAVVWWSTVLMVLQGLLVLGLLFIGCLMYLIGYSEIKARREYAQGASPETEAREKAEAAAAGQGEA